jgi:DNA-binding CsgD family transcriptional regulator
MTYDAGVDPSLWPNFLLELASCYDSDKALLFSAGKQPDQLVEFHSVNLDLSILKKWEGSIDHVDVWFQGLVNKPTVQAEIYSRFLPTKDLQQTGFYADFLVPLDIRYGMGSHLVSDKTTDSFLSVFRHGRLNDFSDKEAKFLAALLPHVRRALWLNHELRMTELRSTISQQIINQCTGGAFVITRSRTLVYSNPRGEDLLRRQDGLRIKHGRLQLTDDTRQVRFDALITSSLSTKGGERRPNAMRISRPTGHAAYQVVVYPIRAIHGDSPNACIVFVRDPEGEELDRQRIADLYHLTKAETTFCVTLFGSGSLEDVLHTLGISRNTAKTHLRHIFDKVAVSSQGQLLKTLALSLNHKLDG